MELTIFQNAINFINQFVDFDYHELKLMKKKVEVVHLQKNEILF